MKDEQPGAGASRFPTTCWGLVAAAGLRAAAEHREALADLCRVYWYPLYAFVRRKGYGPDAAQDLTQAYFTRLLEKGVLSAADQSRGRFRTFLLTDCGHFLADRRDHAHARKRGGGVVSVSIDARDAEGRYRTEPSAKTTPEDLFERAWAVTLLDHVLERLGREHAAAGRTALFEQLKPVLTPGSDAPSYAAIAEALGSSESAIDSAIRRLRRRYRDLVREEIAATLANPETEEVDDEIRSLFAALAG